MDNESERDKSSDELKARITRSRERLVRDLQGLRYELDFPAKVRRSFQSQTVAWVVAAAVVGGLIAALPMRRRKVYVDFKGEPKTGAPGGLLQAGFLLGGLRIAATLLKPMIANFLTSKITDYANRPRASKKW